MCEPREFCGYWADYVMVDEGSQKSAGRQYLGGEGMCLYG